MKRFLPILIALLTLTVTTSGAPMPEVDVVTDIGGEGSVALQTEPYVAPPQSVDHLIPEVAGRDLANTKEICDKRAGISAAYAAGREPTKAQYWRFDGCQRWFNLRQGIGDRR
ncbi:hypothetical protein [Synechococcus phage S-N03]|uniref:Uncharacterized protein n=1 Tax=Synechococcus phage S-N03 TaxID=2718943 RepID=A0A6G8R5Q2_9CAUD|nr:hypothetical protein PQC09_gp081 [Synechococcus phage S-N03]QIN96716.1 hypothetical protein [Synechococcus phage S-N03]